MAFFQPTMLLPQLFPPHITDCVHPVASRFLLEHFNIKGLCLTPFLYFRSNCRIAVLEFDSLSVLAQSLAHFTLFLSFSCFLNPLTEPFPSPPSSPTTISNPSSVFFQPRCRVSRSTLHTTLQTFPFCCSQISPTAF